MIFHIWFIYEIYMNIYMKRYESWKMPWPDIDIWGGRSQEKKIVIVIYLERKTAEAFRPPTGGHDHGEGTERVLGHSVRKSNS